MIATQINTNKMNISPDLSAPAGYFCPKILHVIDGNAPVLLSTTNLAIQHAQREDRGMAESGHHLIFL